MEYYGFFDGSQQYGQKEFNMYFDNIYETGISVSSNNILSFEVKNSGNNLIIEPGYAIIKGFYFVSELQKSITISADTNYDRIDRVVVRLDSINKKVSIELKKGVAASSPVAQSLQRDDITNPNGFVYEISLAQVRISKAGVITITDERSNQSLCGVIRPKYIGEITKEFNMQVEKWLSDIKGKGIRGTFIQTSTPTTGTAGDIWIQTA